MLSLLLQFDANEDSPKALAGIAKLLEIDTEEMLSHGAIVKNTGYSER